MKKVIHLPKRWLLNLIEIQEKKEYNFYVIIIFAVFVGLTRFALEFMLAHRVLYLINISILNFISFYLMVIFLYTLVLRCFIPSFEWKKSIHLVLIGVFLGIFPPVIDAIIYGLGSFSYSFFTHVLDDWTPLIYRDQRSLPIGEAVVLFSTMFFTAIVVYIKTNNYLRTFFAFVLSYFCVFFYAGVLASIAYFLSENVIFQNVNSHNIEQGSEGVLFSGFTYPVLLTLFQIVTTITVYFILNPLIFKSVIKRMNHALLPAFTCLLGYSVYQSIDIYGLMISLVVLYVAVVTTIQNDYFDKKEDEVAGRSSYLSINDVNFFNGSVFLIIALLVAAGHVLGYMILWFFVVSFIYSYDFYRGKSYFPANYKIEGIWGISSFLTGVSMVLTTRYSFAGDVLNIQNFHLLQHSSASIDLQSALAEIWSWEYVLFAFLIFGGWSIISVIKDYKDIESDQVVGNQTLYVLLLRRGKDIKKFHRIYTSVLAALLLIPILWLIKVQASYFFYASMLVLSFLFYLSINKRPSTRSVEVSLMVVNLYLLNFALACSFSH